MSAILSARDVTYVYPDGTAALRGVSIDLAPGENLIFLGANGSGKTTMALCLGGVLKPTSGSVQSTDVGLVFQDSDDQLFMPTVIDDVMFGLLNRGMRKEDAIRLAKSALDRVGLDEARHNRPPYHLSAGEKRRAAIAGVLAMDPRVLILDEPTTFLDPPGHRELVSILQSLPQAKILVTHDVAFATSLGDRALFFEDGRVAGSGPVAELAVKFNWTCY